MQVDNEDIELREEEGGGSHPAWTKQVAPTPKAQTKDNLDRRPSSPHILRRVSSAPSLALSFRPRTLLLFQQAKSETSDTYKNGRLSAEARKKTNHTHHTSQAPNIRSLSPQGAEDDPGKTVLPRLDVIREVAVHPRCSMTELNFETCEMRRVR